jgi:polyhydroxybutyrate depolymerase
MRSYLFFFLLAFSTAFINAQTTINGSFVYGGITRTYSFYVPAAYTPGNSVPMVIGLHGTSSSGSQFAQYRDFRPIADTANFIVVNPDGSTMIGIRYWNYGSVMGSTVDDVGFLEALIDTISAHYSINQDRIYCAGMSNGSFMAYCMACQSNRFRAIAGVTGSMSVSMYNACVPQRPIPTMHIHGTGDSTNPYTGNSTMKAIEDVTQFWVNQNGCNTTPVITSIPNTNISDGATAERYLYSGGVNGHTVELFKVTGGGHSWPGSPMPSSSEVICMDFDASKEIWRFFSQYQNSAVSVQKTEIIVVSVFPNPTSESVFIQSEKSVNDVKITDMQGRLVTKLSGTNIQEISVGELSVGNYLMTVSGDDFIRVKQIAIYR